uniref:Uncharacterized protein n=1 Tax=Setaria viridis TaxID=4556 RepID=A0A4U6VHT6_SETVI|nr:hypothetical protein SEVIR_3G373040v2 [Setaria viridis]
MKDLVWIMVCLPDMPAPTMMTRRPAAVARKAYCARHSTASTRAIIAVDGIISSDNSLDANRMRSGAHTSHIPCISIYLYIYIYL